jgi:acetyl esterase/lipase
MLKALGVAMMAIFMAALSGCSGLRLLDTITPSSGYTRTADIAYGSDPRQRLDVYRPLQAAVGQPVVVFFYGGSWNSGARGQYRYVARALAKRGITVVVADYRLYPQVRYPSFLEDNAQAVGWTHRHIGEYGGNAQRLFLMGHSSGAYNAAMLALDPRWLQAVGMQPRDLSGWIGLAGPYDFLPIDNPEVKPVFFFPDSPPDSQPINHVRAGAPPALLIAANSDSYVNPQRNTAGLAKRLRADGVSVQERYYARVNHMTLVGAFAWPLAWMAPVTDEVVRFIETPPGS